VRLLANIRAYDQPVSFVTVTAPGADVLPWAQGEAAHRTVVPAYRYRWNRSAPDRWRRLHRLASQRVRRRLGQFRVLAREWEYQRRGVLHMHVVLPMATARDRHAAHLYVAALDELRHAHGFGYVDRGRQTNGRRTLPVIPPGAAAAYLAKYLAPTSRGGKMALSETVRQPDVPRLVVYVARELTGRTRVTMRSLRRRRLAWVIEQQTGLPWPLALEAALGEKPTPQLLVRGPRGP
jgi:hypothetical protein